ncbi:exopolysaccharide biosynthesis protein [Histidinibacterium lentulum]|uniref:Exopolysaccharide biosynthesis protein n=1 Tax=Histidinibacterium lentulum TaxID=2480588 RepID=A0A3N2R8M4_9RHOB|nr:exopolysaccharide biosynthesis protein [Histidinibacterium lentulum]ROU03763.1 exopolysaccharide biosynthesis protein [Histidinibacterium lentulum]
MTDATEHPQDRAHPVQDIVNRLDSVAQGDSVSLGEAVEAFGERSFHPVLMVPALLVLSPLSGIPLFSSLCGITIAIISAQMIWPHRTELWLPDFLTHRKVTGARARSALSKLCKTATWLDDHSRERFSVLIRRPGRWVIEAACLLCGLAMPFLEIVPFSSSILGGAVTLMALGLLARDGLFAVLGLLVMSSVGFAIITVGGSLTGSGAG